MINEKNFMRATVLTLALSVAAIGYNQSRARADGIPGTNPLVYSGTLEDGGVGITGTRDLRLTLWDDPVSTSPSNSRCVTAVTGAVITSGRFQVTLDGACTAVVRLTPDLWVELAVNGTPLGRTKISAVPFAVEAARASALTPAASNLLIPTGSVIAFAGATVPTGWLACDGSAVSRVTYAALFTAIGTAHGNDGVGGTFTLPDYRGLFLRGVDGAAGRDPESGSRSALHSGANTGNAVGSYQNEAFLGHTHGVNDPGHQHFYGGLGIVNSTTNTMVFQPGRGQLLDGFNYTTYTQYTSIGINPEGGTETRPRNAYVNYIIKY